MTGLERFIEAKQAELLELERLSMGSLHLDQQLGRGEWRYLTPEEADLLRQNVSG